MAYTRVADPLLDVGEPTRSVDIKQMRDNQDHFDTITRGATQTDQDIRDHFARANATITVDGTDTGKWTYYNQAVAHSIIYQSENHARIRISSNNAANYSYLAAQVEYQRVVKSEEYVAVCEARVKTTAAGTNQFYCIGWNDDGLAKTVVLINDITDFVGVILDKGVTEDWMSITSLAGVTDSSTAFGDPTTWQTIRLEFTCSATAGNRKLDTYLNGTLNNTLSDNTKMPTAYLVPVIGLAGNAAGTNLDLFVDYVEFRFKAIPVAA